MLDRESLEQRALDLISAVLYYELLDNLDITTNQELINIIEGNNND